MKVLQDKLRVCHFAIWEVEKELGVTGDNRAMNIFFNSYQIHRKDKGSIQHLSGEEYENAMCKRYDFMKDRAIEYLKAMAKTEKANLGGKE